MRPRAPTNDTGNLFVVLLNSKMSLFLTMCCLKLLTKFVMLLWHSDMLLFITTCCYPNMGHPHDSVFCLSSLAKCCYSFLAEPLFSDGLLRILNGALSCAICCIVREISARRKLLPRPRASNPRSITNARATSRRKTRRATKRRKRNPRQHEIQQQGIVAIV